jgi:LPXTG-site transpeptidase (sortase) family protein
MTPPPSLNRPVSLNANALFQPRGFEAVRLSMDPPASRSGNIAVGFIKIGRIDLSEWIWYGTEDAQLWAGVGFMPEGAFPHEPGNVLLTGHRTSTRSEPFRYLHLVEIGDYITIKMWGLNYNYKVYDSFVVGSTETWLYNELDGYEQILTLITCDPIVWFTRRPNRLLVRAYLVDITESDD